MKMSHYRYKKENLLIFCIAALKKVGFCKIDAQLASEIIINADMRGVYTHGICSLPIYIKRSQQGGINTKANIEIIKQGNSWGLLDGKGGMGQLTAYKAVKIAIKKAKKNNIAFIGVRNGMHFGAAAYYSIMISKEKMIGLAMCNADPNMTITGAAERVLGTNPFSFSCPTNKENIITLDIAMSTVAAGKIKQAALEGKNIPLGWLLDKNGNPSTDPNDYFDGGILIPMCNHKGYGLALMIEILSGVLTGNVTGKNVCGWYDLSNPCPTGFTFIAIDIASFFAFELFQKDIGELIEQLKTSRKAKGVSKIFLPGEIEHENEKESELFGIKISERVLDSLEKLADELEIHNEFLFLRNNGEIKTTG